MVQFDEVRGYGFIAPDDGGTDVFVHANSLSGPHTPVCCGTRLEFSVLSGDRGPKAYDVRVIGAPSAGPEPEREQAGPGPARGAPDYLARCTEALLADVPDLTARQIVRIRASMLRLAAEMDWIGRG
jgi:cold shock CspA family protein